MPVSARAKPKQTELAAADPVAIARAVDEVRARYGRMSRSEKTAAARRAARFIEALQSQAAGQGDR